MTLILLPDLSFHSLTQNSNWSFTKYGNFEQEENYQEILYKIFAAIAFVEIRNSETNLS